MHTPESKIDEELRDLGLERDLLDAFSDLPVLDLDIPFDDLDLPDLGEVEPPAPRRDERAACEAPSTVPSAGSKSVRITIRIPVAVLAGFKARAAPGSSGYQTLMVRALRDWLATATGPA